MRPGRMYHRIVFYAKTVTRDSYGASVDTYEQSVVTTGELRYTGGTKILSNEEKFYSKNIELRIRYRPEIEESMRVQIDGTADRYMITFIEELGRREGLRLTIEKINI